MIASDLTPDEIAAFRLADNKVAERSIWDKNKLGIELKGIQLDMSAFGFAQQDLSWATNDDSDLGFFGDERLRTDKAYNLDLVNKYQCAGKFGMPNLEPCDYVPERLLAWHYAMTESDHKQGLHFFVDDYRFERLWNQPLRYLDVLKDYECVLTCDFSLYLDMPYPMQQWNVYRSRALGAFWQSKGLRVIPTIQFSDEGSYEFCFDNLPQGGTYATSTVGIMTMDETREKWKEGMKEALKRIKPKTLLVYGSKMPDFDYGNVDVVEIKANTFYKNAKE